MTICLPSLIDFLLEILKTSHIDLVQSVFSKLFVSVSTYDLLRASLASIGVAKWIISLLTIMKLVAIEVFPSNQISIMSAISFFKLFIPHTE